MATDASTIPALEVRGIDKAFGPVQANRSVSLRVTKGSIHGLIGENGAGKSTLANIVHGLHRPDRGEIRVNGQTVQFASPREAMAAGIGMVHQHFKLVDTFTVLENVILGQEGGRDLSRALKAARTELERLAREHGLTVPLDELAGELPVGVRQRVEILKALYRRAEILILDEPTAVLTPQEADHLFRILKKLQGEGKTVVLVTHKLREIMAITDRVTVMRQGAVVAEHATRETSTRELANEMVGRSLALSGATAPDSVGPVALEARALMAHDEHGGVRLNGVSFELRAGEILGIAGVAGNGQTELLEILAGVRPATEGSVWLGGRDITSVGPRSRRDAGLAYVPEDRLRCAVVEAFSAEANSILGYEHRSRYQRHGWMNGAAMRQDCETRMRDYEVRPADPALRFGAFSGGNQQKQVLAREIEGGPGVLLLGQPTRGVDIGAIELIHRRIRQLRDAGKAVLLVSVELDEILALADRILVMSSGRIVGEMTRAEATETKLGLLMAGVKEEG